LSFSVGCGGGNFTIFGISYTKC
jgi:hypothetical protein